MDTNRIKRFATEARNILKAGIAAKITTLGFDKNGNVAEENKPQLMQGGSLWNEQLQTEGFYYQWMSLYNRIQQKGISEVYEEAAYTWFNRLCAIRILQKNNLCSPVLAYADAARTPVIVDEARQGRIPQMFLSPDNGGNEGGEELRQRLMELLEDDTKVTEQFAILITAWCHDNPIINQCFGSIADYTELLLPNNILAEGGFVDMLNHTEFITDEDFQSPELIGWLYQFYISERKDEVFAKKGKFEADEIPAATQIFTPNWIVKYMVQNTVGRIYLDNNPYETQLQKKWQYLVEPSEKPSDRYSLKYNELTDLKVADLACGSGHILNECFDLLYDLYIAEGYGRGEAVENIFSHNLTGIDLDTRAKQLSQFALLLKACQKDAAFADAHCLPNVLTMPKPWNRKKQGPLEDMLHIYFQGEATNEQKEEMAACFDLMQNADTLGSIMKFDISESTRLLIKQTTDYWCSQEIVPEEVRTQMPAFKLILALTEKYHALVMNPPYMGGGRFDEVLSKYVKDNYEEGKADLFSVFMQMGMKRLVDGGKMAQINMQSWMFLSSFEKLRDIFLHNYIIDSMLHLGTRTFDELSGEVVQNTAFVLTKPRFSEYGMMTSLELASKPLEKRKAIVNKLMEEVDSGEFKKNIREAKGTYYRLVDGKNCADKEQMFLANKDGNEDGKHIYYPNVEQKYFKRIPRSIIGYWFSAIILKAYQNELISNYFIGKEGVGTRDDAKFLRNIWEVSTTKIGENKKWIISDKAGNKAKWFGNILHVMNWENNGFEIRNFRDEKGKLKSRPQNLGYLFKEALAWSKVSKSGKAFRYRKVGLAFNDAAPSLFYREATDSKHNIKSVIGLLNSKVGIYFLSLNGDSTNTTVSDIEGIPLRFGDRENYILNIVEQNISISKHDWDAHETSWDFQRNELLSINTSTYMENIDYKIKKHFEETGEHIDISPAPPKLGSLEWRMEQYKTKWERKFMQLHKNEEELNRQFINIYGLQDELTPDVPLNEITILQQGEISIE